MKRYRNAKPPRWIDRFLEWYCRADLLEEIQGDAYELYTRSSEKSKFRADLLFLWNVLRFFRLKNIKRTKSLSSAFQTSPAMLKNILLVSIRNFFRQPAHSLLNVAGLAVSFSAAFLIVLWVFHEMSYDHFHRDPQRIFKVLSHVGVSGSVETYDVAQGSMDISSVPEIDEKLIVISGTRWPNELCFRPEGKTNECIYLNGVFAGEPFFRFFSFPIVKGDPNPLASPSQIAISENMAARLFGTENPLGKIIKIDDSYEVTIGSIFRDVPTNSTVRAEFVLPLAIFKKMRGFNDDQFANDFHTTYVRTHADQDASAVTARLQDPAVLNETLRKDHVQYEAVPFTSWHLNGEFQNGTVVGGRIEYVRLFIIVAMLVMVMAVINFVNLSTARAATRSKEIGIRKVTGALRSAIVIQFIGESFFIMVLAVAVACSLTYFALPWFYTLTGEVWVLPLLTIQNTAYLLAFLAGVSILAGLYPALVMSAFQPAKVLKGEIIAGKGIGNSLRQILLISQVSISVCIIVFTGILFNQLSYIKSKNLGFDRDNMISIEPTYTLLKSFDEFKAELLKHPEIVQVTASNANPLTLSGHTTGVLWPGMPADARPTFQVLGCHTELPETFGMRMLEGKTFAEKPVDTVNSEVIVTKEAARIMDLKDPIGATFTIGAVSCVIIGVIEDFHSESLRKHQLPVVLYRHPILNCSRVFVKYQPGTTPEAIAAIQATYQQFEPAFTMKYNFQDDIFANLYKTEQVASSMIVFFAILSLVIALVGIIGLTTYHVVRRKKEIGIRRVFGASVTSILLVFSREFGGLVAIASAIAFPLAWYGANQWLSGFAYRIDMPWWIFGATFLGIAFLTIALICLQALRTAQMNPTLTLRNE